MSPGLDVEVPRADRNWQEARERRMKAGRKMDGERERGGGPEGAVTSSQELGW